MDARRVAIDGRPLQDGSSERGVGRYLRGLLAGLAACADREIRVELVLDDLGRLRRDPPELDADGRVLGLPVRRAHLDVGRLAPGRRNRTLNRSLRSLGVDLLHVPAQLYFFRGELPALPTVVTVHDLIPFTGVVRGRTRRRLARLRRAVARASAVIADSEHTRADCQRLLKLPEDSLRVIPLGIDERFRLAAEPPEPVLRRHGIEPPYFLYVGAQDRHKNLPTLLEAFERVRGGGGVDCRLVVVGRKPRRGVPWAGRPGIVHLDFVADEELVPLYRGAAALTTLSRYEGFGIPADEAMACGTPVIASDATVFPALVGDAGLLVPADDPGAAAAAMLRVLREPALARQLVERGRKRAERLTWESAARATLGVYRRALGPGD